MRGSERSFRERENEEAFSGKPRGAYHRFFEGYTEAKVLKENGRGERIIRRYTAPWKQPDLSRKEFVRQKLASAALVLTAVLLILFAAFYGAAAHNASYIAFFEMLTALSMILLAASVLTYLTAGYRMTLWEYRSGSQNLQMFGKTASALSGLTSAAILVHAVITAKANASDHLLSAAAAFCACGLLALMAFRESRVTYLDVPNDTSKPENGREIWLE